MRSRFPDALVTGWQPLEGTFGLPDRNDEHVLAAAVTAGAASVVTDNLRDFPAASMPPGIAALTPARFAAAVVETDPARGAGAVVAMAARSGRHGPRLAPGEVLDVRGPALGPARPDAPVGGRGQRGQQPRAAVAVQVAQGTTVTALVGEALGVALANREQAGRSEPCRVRPLPAGRGLQPGVDLDDHAGLADLVDDDAHP